MEVLKKNTDTVILPVNDLPFGGSTKKKSLDEFLRLLFDFFLEPCEKKKMTKETILVEKKNRDLLLKTEIF